MEPNFKFYEIDEIIKLLQSKERLVYVDDGIEEAVIRYKDLPDFIVDYNEKCGLKDIKVYDYENPNMDKPLLDTFGVFLNKCEPKVREDIIYRLVMLQRGEIEVKDYKIIDEDTLDVANEKIEQEKMKKNIKKEVQDNMSLDFIHIEEKGIKYLVHPAGSIFEGIKIRENPNDAFENAIKRGMKNPDDWMYMYSENNKDFFKNYYSRTYKSFPQIWFKRKNKK